MRKALTLLAVAAIVGCATAPRVAPGTTPTKPERKLVEQYPEKLPDWIFKTPEDKDYLYFVGMRSDYSGNLEDAFTDAEQTARRKAAEAISTRVLSIYERARVEGLSSEMEEALKDAFINKAKATIRGALIAEKAYKKEFDPTDGQYYYTVYVLLKYPKAEFKRAMMEEVRKQKKQHKNNVNAVETLNKMEQLMEKEF